MISPIILTRSSYLYVLSVSHTASRIVKISLLMNLEYEINSLSEAITLGFSKRGWGRGGQGIDLDACDYRQELKRSHSPVIRGWKGGGISATDHCEWLDRQAHKCFCQRHSGMTQLVSPLSE